MAELEAAMHRGVNHRNKHKHIGCSIFTLQDLGTLGDLAHTLYCTYIHLTHLINSYTNYVHIRITYIMIIWHTLAQVFHNNSVDTLATMQPPSLVNSDTNCDVNFPELSSAKGSTLCYVRMSVCMYVHCRHTIHWLCAMYTCKLTTCGALYAPPPQLTRVSFHSGHPLHPIITGCTVSSVEARVTRNSLSSRYTGITFGSHSTIGSIIARVSL